VTRALALMLFVGLAIAPLASAQGYSLTGSDFLRRCEGPYRNDAEKLAYSSFCTGYLQGLQQMHHVVIDFYKSRPLYCEPTATGNYDQLERVVVKWLKNNPEQLHRDARILVTRALMEGFPCQ